MEPTSADIDCEEKTPEIITKIVSPETRVLLENLLTLQYFKNSAGELLVKLHLIGDDNGDSVAKCVNLVTDGIVYLEPKTLVTPVTVKVTYEVIG